MLKISHYRIISGGVVLIALSQEVRAQAQAPQRDTVARGLPTMTVTAERREQSAQRTAVSVTTLTGTQLTERGVRGTSDLTIVTPSLQVEPAFGGAQLQFRLRGVGFSDYAVNNSGTVALYLDDVALPFPVQAPSMLFDLARVEVLRGPQGTLYGRNSTGGAVKLVSARPTRTREAGAQWSVGQFGSHDADAYLNGPLGKQFAGRLSIGVQEGGAWQKNRVSSQSLGGRDQLGARAQLAWIPSPATNVRLVTSLSQDNGDATGLSLFAPFSTRGGNGSTIPADAVRGTGWGLRPAFASVLGVNANDRPGRRNQSVGALLDASIARGRVTLTSLTSVNRLKRREIGDWDASNSAESDEAFYDNITVSAQEFRIASDTARRVDWQAGTYAAREELSANFYSDFTDVPGLGAAALTRYGQRADVLAVFGQAGVALAPMWRLVAGARLEYEQRALMGLTTGFINPAVTFVPPTDRSLITREPSAKLALEFRPSSSTLGYASASRGIKSGGFTAYNTTNVAQLAAFNPEVVYAYEVGLKQRPTKSLQLNSAAYFNDYRQQQVLSTVYDQVSKGPIGRIVNAPKSRVAGAETELTWTPARGLTIAPYVGYTEGRYLDFTTVDAQASIQQQKEVSRDFSGKAMPIPRWSLGGNASYARIVGHNFLQAQINTSYRDRQTASRLIFTPVYDVAPYALVNGSLTYARAGAPWSLELWGRNLLDRRYELTRNFFINAQVAAPGAPRMIGVRLKVSTL